jgi:hypothetical protein
MVGLDASGKVIAVTVALSFMCFANSYISSTTLAINSVAVHLHF